MNEPCISPAFTRLLSVVTICAVASAVGSLYGQSVGYQAQVYRVEGQNPLLQSEESRSGGFYLRAAAETSELGAAASVEPYERHGRFAVVSLGGIFLKTIAEEAGGGLNPDSQDERLLTALAGATEDILTVDAGPQLEGRRGIVSIPLHIRYRPIMPRAANPPDGAFWSYAVNYAALTGDVETATPHWEEKEVFTMVNYVFLGGPNLIPQGTDFNSVPILLRVPITFGTPELFTVTGGVSVMAPFSRARSGGDPGSVVRLELSARFLPGVPSKVETEDGQELPAGSWKVSFGSGHDYSVLPEMAAPDLVMPANGQPGTLTFEAPPGLTGIAERSDEIDSWVPLGPEVDGSGAATRVEWLGENSLRQFFRVTYSLTPFP